MAETKRNIIVAPHPDDELIGCFELLYEKPSTCTVIVFEKILDEIISKERIRESQLMGEHLGYNVIVFVDPILFKNIIRNELFWKPNEIILWLPEQNEHYHHSYVTYVLLDLKRSYEELTLGFYTVKMNTSYTRRSKYGDLKMKYAYTFFPSQKEFFDNNQHVFIFEGRVIVDW